LRFSALGFGFAFYIRLFATFLTFDMLKFAWVDDKGTLSHLPFLFGFILFGVLLFKLALSL